MLLVPHSSTLKTYALFYGAYLGSEFRDDSQEKTAIISVNNFNLLVFIVGFSIFYVIIRHCRTSVIRIANPR
jgi:hypothetical protein